MGTGFKKDRHLHVSALQIWQGSGSCCQQLYALRTTSLSYELQTKGKVIHIHLISFVRSKAPPLSSSFDPKWSGKRFSQKKSRKFLSNFIQVLIPVSLIWTISTLRYVIWGPGFRSWSVSILSVRHLQLYIFPEVKLVIWWFPTLGVTPQASKSWMTILVLKQPWWRLGIPHDLRNIIDAQMVSSRCPASRLAGHGDLKMISSTL